ncbi:MAG: hypothetical protein ACPG8W_04315 [Candidatus Promineifilaceae bacterium]
MEWFKQHQSISMWLALAIGMIAILTYEARDVGLEPSQWFWLIVITAGVAALCIWILTWGDEEDEELVE